MNKFPQIHTAEEEKNLEPVAQCILEHSENVDKTISLMQRKDDGQYIAQEIGIVSWGKTLPMKDEVEAHTAYYAIVGNCLLEGEYKIKEVIISCKDFDITVFR